MCVLVDCTICGKKTWSGCGHCLDTIFIGIPQIEICNCLRINLESSSDHEEEHESNNEEHELNDNEHNEELEHNEEHEPNDNEHNEEHESNIDEHNDEHNEEHNVNEHNEKHEANVNEDNEEVEIEHKPIHVKDLISFSCDGYDIIKEFFNEIEFKECQKVLILSDVAEKFFTGVYNGITYYNLYLSSKDLLDECERFNLLLKISWTMFSNIIKSCDEETKCKYICAIRKLSMCAFEEYVEKIYQVYIYGIDNFPDYRIIYKTINFEVPCINYDMQYYTKKLKIPEFYFSSKFEELSSVDGCLQHFVYAALSTAKTENQKDSAKEGLKMFLYYFYKQLGLEINPWDFHQDVVEFKKAKSDKSCIQKEECSKEGEDESEKGETKSDSECETESKENEDECSKEDFSEDDDEREYNKLKLVLPYIPARCKYTKYFIDKMTHYFNNERILHLFEWTRLKIMWAPYRLDHHNLLVTTLPDMNICFVQELYIQEAYKKEEIQAIEMLKIDISNYFRSVINMCAPSIVSNNLDNVMNALNIWMNKNELKMVFCSIESIKKCGSFDVNNFIMNCRKVVCNYKI